jgi:hypothetical protein
MKIHESDDLVPLEDAKLNCYTFDWSLSIITELYDNGVVKSETNTAVASYVFDVMKKMYGLENPYVIEIATIDAKSETPLCLTVEVNDSLWQNFNAEQKQWAIMQIRRYGRLNDIKIRVVSYTREEYARLRYPNG